MDILHYLRFMIMQDACILSAMLTDVTGTTSPKSQISSIMRIYDAIRGPIGNTSIAVTKACGKLTGLTDEEKELLFGKARDKMVPHEVLVIQIKKLENRRGGWNGSARMEESSVKVSSSA